MLLLKLNPNPDCFLSWVSQFFSVLDQVWKSILIPKPQFWRCWKRRLILGKGPQYFPYTGKKQKICSHKKLTSLRVPDCPLLYCPQWWWPMKPSASKSNVFESVSEMHTGIRKNRFSVYFQFIYLIPFGGAVQSAQEALKTSEDRIGVGTLLVSRYWKAWIFRENTPSLWNYGR